MSELVLYTSNISKIELAKGEFPRIVAQKPNFNEEEIKNAIDRNSLKHPLEYPLTISQEKFRSLPEEKKAIRVVSDSVVAVRDEDGRWLALNRNEDKNNLKEAEEIAKRTGIIYFIGAVTFGVNQPYSLLSYCKIYLRPDVDLSFPFNINSIPEMVDPQKGFKVGYFDHNFEERPICDTFNFDSPDKSQGRRARPFISGLTREVLEMAELLGNFEIKVIERLKDLISSHPFNTLSFYALTHGFNEDQLRSFYSSLFDDPDYFEKYGGNCSLFSYRLGKKLEELGYQVSVVIFPSKNPDKEDGHSGVLVRLTEKLTILLDPGLSIPSLLPLSEFPLHYSVDYGNSKIAKLRFDEEDNLILVISSPKKGEVEFPSKRVILLEEFKNQAPEILLDLHKKRKRVKIDFHDENGRQIMRIILNLDEGKLIINDQSFDDPNALKKFLDKTTIPGHLIENIISLLI